MATEQKLLSRMFSRSRSWSRFNWHGHCTTGTVDTVLGKFHAACVSKITVELTTFLPFMCMNKTIIIMEDVADLLWTIMSNAATL